MYPILLFMHSLFRWILPGAMLTAIITGVVGYKKKLVFSAGMNVLRHWTATISHIQLIIGIIIWSQSSWVKAFLRNKMHASGDALFFGLIHFSGMLLAIVLITIGSAKAKREVTDRQKFKTMFLWFAAALFIILLLVPWPFSPLAPRPVFRSYR